MYHLGGSDPNTHIGDVPLGSLDTALLFESLGGLSYKRAWRIDDSSNYLENKPQDVIYKVKIARKLSQELGDNLQFW